MSAQSALAMAERMRDLWRERERYFYPDAKGDSAYVVDLCDLIVAMQRESGVIPSGYVACSDCAGAACRACEGKGMYPMPVADGESGPPIRIVGGAR